MDENTGILLDEQFDLLISGGSFVNGDSTMSEVGVLLGLNKGELKSDPLLGPNLLRLTRSVNGRQRVSTVVKLHLQRDGKRYNDVKELIRLNNGQI